MSLRLQRRHVAKTGNYTIRPFLDAPGTVFNNRGASGAVTFTLPKPTFTLLGVEYLFQCVADQNLGVAAATAGDMITFNDAAANSLTLQTGGQKIGGRISAVCVESAPKTYKWATIGTAVGFTYTVAT